jgi:hypothetical protein
MVSAKRSTFFFLMLCSILDLAFLEEALAISLSRY